ncbi:MAG: hypothetical protein M3364_05110 [Actinomycetota bacterium]|nr:hypothetical protein [Actinomycetota bacterium]
MRHSRKLRLGASLALGITAAVTFAAAASAGQIFSEHFRDAKDSEIISNFCGAAGLTVEFATTADGHVHAVTHGRDGLAYFGAQIRQTEVVTNLANGNSVRSASTFVDKDLRVTDNGDGTLTLLILATGNAVLYGDDGKVIARNTGQQRVEILVDHGGTPSDPRDDEFLEFLGVVKDSTGRNDDFCEFAVPMLTA